MCVYSGPLPVAVTVVIEHTGLLMCGLISTVLSHSNFKTKWVMLCTFECKCSVCIIIVVCLNLDIRLS